MNNIKDKSCIVGKYRITKYRAGTKDVLWQSPWIHNLVVESATTGTGLVATALADGSSIQITRAAIGTGSTAPADGDTNLGTPVLTDVLPILTTVSTNVAVIEFFMTDAELANGTYTEFGIYCGNSWANRKLFARSIISPSYSKGSSEDTQIAYQLTVNN